MTILMQEKISALPDDIGHDVASVETLLRNHENFERDVAAIGTQVCCKMINILL